LRWPIFERWCGSEDVHCIEYSGDIDGEFERRQGTVLSRNANHRSCSGLCFWKVSTIAFGLVLPVALIVTSVNFRLTKADEYRPWRISAKVVSGLSANRTRTADAPAGAEWRAEVPETSWQFIVIHHSGSESGSVSAIHEEHRQRKDSSGNSWLGIGYHFVIGNGHGMKDGAVEATFRWNDQLHGAHSGDGQFNARGIGICLIGNFEKTAPTDAQLQSIRKLVKALAIRHRIPRSRLMGHASVKATACPGKHFPLKELRTVIPEFQS
jgi:hypothetical protein